MKQTIPELVTEAENALDASGVDLNWSMPDEKERIIRAIVQWIWQNHMKRIRASVVRDLYDQFEAGREMG